MDFALQKIQSYTILTRPKNTVPLGLAYLIGIVFVAGNSGFFNLIVCLGLVMLCKMSVTVWNDVSDFAVDVSNHRKSGLHSGEISLYQAKLFAAGLALAAVFAARLSDHPWLGLAYCVVFGAVGWLYNDPPVQLSHRPVASIVTLGAVYGPLPMLYGALIVQQSSVSAFIFGSLLLAWFMQRSSISILKDYKDVKGDAKHHKQTFYLRYGAMTTARTSLALMLISAIYIFVILAKQQSPFSLFDWLFMLILIILFGFNVATRRSLLYTSSDAGRAKIFQLAYLRQNIFDGVVLAWLILS